MHENLIGKTFGSLTVVKMLAHRKVLCECACSLTFKTHLLYLEEGSRQRCDTCDRKLKSLKTLSADLSELDGLIDVEKAKILRAYARHLRACDRCGTTAETFVRFVAEAKQDPDLEQEEEPELSFDLRFQRSNQQRYRVYESPKDRSIVTIK